MEQSNFQFTNPRIEKIDFRISDANNNSNDMPISIDVKAKTNLEDKKAIVKLNLIVGEIDDDNKIITSLYFDGVITANFKWNEEVKDPDRMLEVNGGTVLLSYIRPILATLTMQAGLQPLNLPFVNFTK